MIVLTSSVAPRYARSQPAIPAKRAPATAPTAIKAGTMSTAGSVAQESAAHAVASAPTCSWPSPPMLKMLARKLTAAASPVNTRGMA